MRRIDDEPVAELKRIDMNNLAREIAKVEGKRQQVNIAQIKEVLKCTLDLLANHYNMAQCVLLLEERRNDWWDGNSVGAWDWIDKPKKAVKVKKRVVDHRG